MLRISHETTKKTLLQYLTAEAGKQGDLVLCIDYLPSFLDTYISFRVFAFQISNYPRNILWFSTNNHILLFLQQSGAPIFVPMEQNLLNYNQTAPQDLRDKDSFTAQDIQEFNFPNFSALSKIPHTPSSITAKELIQEKSSYTRSSLLEENEPTKKLASPDPVNISNIQNFDTWIEKIAATKEALNTIKDSSSSFTYKKAPKKWSNLSLVRNFSLVAVFLGVAGFLIFALFPTKALTIEIQSLSKDKQAEIEVSPSQFRSKNISFKNEKTVNTSDFLEEKVKYATGKVSLVNLSGNSIDLDNGSFKVVKDGKEYKANFNSSYPKTFTIPGKGSLNDFQVQSTKDGDGFNLSEGTKLDITNLSGAGFRVCSNCFALVTSEIKNTGLSNKKIVSESAIKSGKADLENNVTLMRESEIKNLGGGENIVDKSWYKSSSSIFNFDKNIGDVSDTLKIQGNFETTLFYLPKSALESMLKSQDSSIFKINNIILSATSGDFENGKTPLKLKIYYTYSQQDDCFDKEEFVNNLSSTSFDQAKEDLQKKCPNVKNVDKKETGMNILGIQSRVDVNVIKN